MKVKEVGTADQHEGFDVQRFVTSVRKVEIFYPPQSGIETQDEPFPFALFSMRSRGARFEQNATACIHFLFTILTHATLSSSYEEMSWLLTCVDLDNHVVEFSSADNPITEEAFLKLETLLRAYSDVFGWSFSSDKRKSANSFLVPHGALQS